MMTQYDERVEKQRLKLEAEEWAWHVKCVHIHQLKSMWYDDRPADTDDSPVTDVQYNNGVIVRSKNGKEIHRFGSEKRGENLLHSFLRKSQYEYPQR